MSNIHENSVQVTEVWASQAQLPFLLENGKTSGGSSCAVLGCPSLAHPPRSWPGYPLVLIPAWIPAKGGETVIRDWD